MGMVDGVEQHLDPKDRATWRFMSLVALVIVGGLVFGWKTVGWAKEQIIITARDANALGAQASQTLHADHERRLSELRETTKEQQKQIDDLKEKFTALKTDALVREARRNRRDE